MAFSNTSDSTQKILMNLRSRSAVELLFLGIGIGIASFQISVKGLSSIQQLIRRVMNWIKIDQ